MICRGLAVFALSLAVLQAPVATAGQAASHPAASHAAQQAPVPIATNAPASAEAAAAKPDCAGAGCDYQPAHITIATPAPAPAPWPLQDRIAWGANLVLVLLGYGGILLAVSTLRKIERQTRYAETAATAAAESAQAALLQAQAILHAERPWILITAEPSRGADSGFSVVATNRGRSPARIVGLAEETRIATDEKQLPPRPEFKNVEPGTPQVPIILLPGESTAIKQFSRDDVKALCDSEQELQRVETWEDKIFIYGKVIYIGLIGPADQQKHESGWCCWYIHGRQKSGLVMAGAPEYNLHT